MPNSNGWKVEIDGESVPVKKLGGFIGGNVEQGHHDVELHYIPKGFYIGLVISITSVFILGVVSFLDLGRKKILKLKWDKGV